MAPPLTLNPCGKALLAAKAVEPLVDLIKATPEEFQWNSDCDGCFAEPLEGRRFKVGQEEGDLCQDCIEAHVEDHQNDQDDSIRELPRDIAAECLIALITHAECRSLMAGKGASQNSKSPLESQP